MAPNWGATKVHPSFLPWDPPPRRAGRDRTEPSVGSNLPMLISLRGSRIGRMSRFCYHACSGEETCVGATQPR